MVPLITLDKSVTFTSSNHHTGHTDRILHNSSLQETADGGDDQPSSSQASMNLQDSVFLTNDSAKLRKMVMESQDDSSRLYSVYEESEQIEPSLNQ